MAAGISERSNFGCWKLDRAYFFAAGGEDERTRSAAVRTRGNGVRFRVKGASERLKKNKRRVYRSTPNPKARPRVAARRSISEDGWAAERSGSGMRNVTVGPIGTTD